MSPSTPAALVRRAPPYPPLCRRGSPEGSGIAEFVSNVVRRATGVMPLSMSLSSDLIDMLERGRVGYWPNGVLAPDMLLRLLGRASC